MLEALGSQANAKKTLQDLRKKRKSSREGVVSVCTPANIASVNFLTLKMFWLLFNSSAVPNLQLLEQKAESIFDGLNNSHVGVIQRAVLNKKMRAQQLGYLNFFLGHFGERNSSEQFWYFNFFHSYSVFGEEQFSDFPIGLALSHFQGGTVKKTTLYIDGIQCDFMPKSCWKHSNFENR